MPMLQIFGLPLRYKTIVSMHVVRTLYKIDVHDKNSFARRLLILTNYSLSLPYIQKFIEINLGYKDIKRQWDY